MAHKRSLGMALDLIWKTKNNTTEKLRFRKCDLKYLCWAGYFKFASKNLTTNDSISYKTFGAGITPKACTK